MSLRRWGFAVGDRYVGVASRLFGGERQAPRAFHPAARFDMNEAADPYICSRRWLRCPVQRRDRTVSSSETRISVACRLRAAHRSRDQSRDFPTCRADAISSSGCKISEWNDCITRVIGDQRRGQIVPSRRVSAMSTCVAHAELLIKVNWFTPLELNRATKSLNCAIRTNLRIFRT